MKVFSYIRVSGLGQVDKDGPVRQRESIQKFCSQHSLHCEEEFFEGGVSGTIEGLERPKFAEMIERLDADPEVKAIVVENMSRLARDLMVSEVLLRELRKRGVQVFAADQVGLIDLASDEGDPMRKALRQIMGVLAELDKSVLVKRLATARARKRKQFGRCEGIRAYGHTAQEAIIRDLILKLQGTHSLRGIAGALNQSGYYTRLGKAWNKFSVFNVITQRKVKK